MDLTPGSLLERGKYRIISALGRGGFGITYLAEQVMAKRKVCIKEFFPKDYYKRDEDTSALSLFSESNAEVMGKFKAKFIKEAQTIASLDHSNIIHIHDVFEENGTAYYVMEYVEGGSLRDIVKEQGPLSESDAKRCIRAVASALDYLHEQRINHLDVKPGNIMVRTKDDSAILIDFGLSKHYDAVGEQTSSTPIGISHGYAPIEQYTSGGVKEFSPSTDIYGLGATLYYLVTGEMPPHATDVGEEGLPKLPDHLSHGVCQAIERSMQYWRKDRPQSIKEFLKLLDDDKIVAPVAEATIINVEPKSVDESTVIDVEPKQTPQPKNEPKPKKSKRGLWLGIFLFVVAAVASFILFGGGSSKKESAPKSAVATVDTLASSNDSLNLAKPKVDTLQLNDTPKEQPKEEPKEEAKPSETKPVAKPEPPTKENAKPVTQPNNEIWYTSSDGKVVKPYKEGKDIFGAEIESNTYNDGKGILKFKDDVTTIGEYAFWCCKSLTGVTIPDSVTSIGEDAFGKCSSLTSITIPNSVTTIGGAAFSECGNLTSVTIPNSVTTIGADAFYECKSLKRVTIPNSVTTIGDGAFSGCQSLRSVTIPNSVKTIGDGAFSSCDNLTSVTIPNSVTTIGESAFRYCESLTSVTIPDSVKTIEDEVFWGCPSLKEFKSKFASPDGRCLIINRELVAFAPAGITEYTIPNSVTEIGERAFGGCKSLTSVTIPNSVTEIGECAFVYCSSLKEFKSKFASPDGRCLIVNGKLIAFAPAGITKFTISDSVTTIGEWAFCCDNLTSVTIPNSVTTIGESAFRQCESLKSVTIPDSVTTIGDRAFEWCCNLTSVTIPNSVTTIGESAFSGCFNLTSVTIPNSVTTIGESTFFGCVNLTSATIPNSVTTIGEMAFQQCEKLTSITIPNSVTTIGNYAFYECKSLKSVTIPNSVTTIGEEAFAACESLTSVTIPDSVTTIGEWAFFGCDNLSEETKNKIKSINPNA